MSAWWVLVGAVFAALSAGRYAGDADAGFAVFFALVCIVGALDGSAA